MISSRRGLGSYVGLLDEKPGFEPQARHQDKSTKSISWVVYAQQISGKNIEKNLSFGVDFKL